MGHVADHQWVVLAGSMQMSLLTSRCSSGGAWAAASAAANSTLRCVSTRICSCGSIRCQDKTGTSIRTKRHLPNEGFKVPTAHV